MCFEITKLVLVASAAVLLFIPAATNADFPPGDVDCSGFVDIDDVVYLITYIFGAGPPPCDSSGPSGRVVGSSPCKSWAGSPERDTVPSNMDCVEFAYDGESTLQINHINAGLNCCPVIVADISVENSNIKVEEIDSLWMGGCECLCLFDIYYEITNLPPGTYSITFIEPYIFPDEDTLVFTADLTAVASGSHCIERFYYPWGW
jgi:hypothetical protein